MRECGVALSQAPPAWVLPLFYLMDSILKNNHGIYVPLFGVNIMEMFGAAYEVVRAYARRR